MTSPADSADPPMAEPGKRPTGADVGGVRATGESGVADGAQRSTERADVPAVGHAAARAATTGPAAGPGIARSENANADADDDDKDADEWRHPPVAPVDERNPLRSLGKAIADTVTGSDADTPRPPKR